ncbi:hypothetical protein GCM10010274_27130 [Streptomyces lavendofoliae]|uniref:Lipoprotein n=1 Tax=Streptomyces lavendofoliae TaxID=67314 RepID=A0A918HYH2_9ACTN|nr:hypothetical protein GCM10010274_27130 [Streptomyces lavendofoliae]
MRLRRIAPPVVTALLLLSGCTSVGGGPTTPRPSLAPAGGRLSSPVRELPAPRPAPVREELAHTGPVPAPPPGRAAGNAAREASAGPGQRSPRRAEHRPPEAAGEQGLYAPRERRDSARDRRPVGAPRAGAPRGPRTESVPKRPLPRRSVGMRDLCRASHGVADPSIVSLCHRTYG